jgi:ornithine cyclodeaminase
MSFIDAEAVHRLLPYPALVDALRHAHRQQAMPGVQESILPEPGPDRDRCFLSLAAWQRDRTVGVKLLSVFPDNKANPSIQGLYALFDGKSGAPMMVADGTALTLRKTAADSALGLDILARRDVETMLMVGAGALAPHVIQAFTSIRPSLRQVKIWNRTSGRAKAVADSVEIAGVHLEVATNLDDALAWADVVSCATMATEPLVRGTRLKPGSHVDLIGGWQPAMRESDDETVQRARIFVDSKEMCRACGDISQPLEAGIITWSDIRGDLFDLCGKSVPGRTSGEEITLYKNAGGAHLDLFTAEFLSEEANK